MYFVRCVYDYCNLTPTNNYQQVSLPTWSELAELRKLLCPKLEPYCTEGKVQGVKVSLASSLGLHLRRLIQTGQAPFLASARGSLVCDVLLRVDGRGDKKAGVGNKIFFLNCHSYATCLFKRLESLAWTLRCV